MIDPTLISFDRDAWGRLVLKLGNGETHIGVEPVRCFPLSDPQKEIALLDSEGKELLTLTDLNSLTPDAKLILELELTSRDFVPVIQRIVSTTNPSPPCHWIVETDRGKTSFQLESEDDVRKLGPFRVMIADSNGIRYTIPDTRQLDTHSQRTVLRLA